MLYVRSTGSASAFKSKALKESTEIKNKILKYGKRKL